MEVEELSKAWRASVSIPCLVYSEQVVTWQIAESISYIFGKYWVGIVDVPAVHFELFKFRIAFCGPDMLVCVAQGPKLGTSYAVI